MKDSIDRIAVALERIAVALEKANDPVVVKQETPASYFPSGYDVSTVDCSGIHVWTGPTAEDHASMEAKQNKSHDGDNITHYGFSEFIDPSWKLQAPTSEDDKNAETCRPRFSDGGIIKGTGLRDGEIPAILSPGDYYDRELTEEESHILNRAIKRSTIKVHGGKLEKD